MKFKLLVIGFLAVMSVGIFIFVDYEMADVYQRGYDSAINDISNGRVASLPPTHDLGALSKSYEAGQRDAEENTAKCTLKLAQAGRCWLPCSSEADCLQKNGRRVVEK